MSANWFIYNVGLDGVSAPIQRFKNKKTGESKGRIRYSKVDIAVAEATSVSLNQVCKASREFEKDREQDLEEHSR